MKFILFRILFLTIIFLTGCADKEEILMNINLNNKEEKDENLFVYNCNDKIVNHIIKTNNDYIEIKICIIADNILSINLQDDIHSIQDNALRIENCEDKKKFINNDFYICKLNDEMIRLGLIN
ncbi:hypothetical protein [Aliarcobacter butzleri]|uniref:hypothetical protein n=1 Tax=Aliarcobacter butzleri TaxID=28197 RepID=UPI00125EF724|nr:hypothetical protein [Aliarcobacter butzleri]